MIKRNIPAIMIFILSCLACIFLSYSTTSVCEELLNYTWTVQSGVGGVVFSLIKMFIIWVAGVTVWFLIRKKLQPHRYRKIKLFYFALLPLVIFSKQLMAIPGDMLNRPMERSICDKTTSNGMTTESKNITLQEYDYLRIHLQLLPQLPVTSEKINISYYTDNFLADYRLSVHFECGVHEAIDTTNHLWSVSPIEGTSDKKEVTFEKGAG
jgi:hypothetical protein